MKNDVVEGELGSLGSYIYIHIFLYLVDDSNIITIESAFSSCISV